MKGAFHILYLYILPLTILLSNADSCNKQNNIGTDNMSGTYKPGKDALHPEYVLFHKTKTISELYFKVNSRELLYSKPSNGDQFGAHISIHYNLISVNHTKDIIDSATVLVNDVFSTQPKDLIGKIDIEATYTNNYILEVILSDLNKGVRLKRYMVVEKENNVTRQNFLLLSADEKLPLFRNYVRENEKFLLRYQSEPGASLQVRYYNRNFPLSLPPFSNENIMPFEFKADSIFSLQISDRDTTGILFGKKGFYHVQTDTASAEGFTIFRFDDDFPMVKQYRELLEPLRFLTAEEEYEKMDKSDNLKTTIDNFWLQAAGSTDRARDLVRKYYNRVQSSNEFFTSFVPGWKTDRGMIYLVFGSPNIIYKSPTSEKWIYGEEKNFNSLSFSFLKVINPFTDNDYRLERSDMYKPSWTSGVDMWRQGRIYSDK